MQTIAVLMTCHNRKDKTLACLAALFANTLPEGYALKVFLVDDGSTDGTGAAVAGKYPEVQVVLGDGSLYWCGGMRLAFSTALTQNYDSYLFLNDDTELYPNAIVCLLNSHQKILQLTHADSMIVGSVIDPKTGELTYGGRTSRGWKQPLYYDFVIPETVPVLCDTANANCLFVPKYIADNLGNLDSAFIHDKADFDYGLRAKRKGMKTYVASEVVGTCPANPYLPPATFNGMTMLQKWKYLTSPKQYPPVEWLIYTWRHAGPLWFLHWMRPYRRLFD